MIFDQTLLSRKKINAVMSCLTVFSSFKKSKKRNSSLKAKDLRFLGQMFVFIEHFLKIFYDYIFRWVDNFFVSQADFFSTCTNGTWKEYWSLKVKSLYNFLVPFRVLILFCYRKKLWLKPKRFQLYTSSNLLDDLLSGNALK